VVEAGAERPEPAGQLVAAGLLDLTRQLVASRLEVLVKAAWERALAGQGRADRAAQPTLRLAWAALRARPVRVP
jgi:hypothetical protein